MKEIQKISCPKCGEAINVNDLLYHQLEEKVQQDFKGKVSELEKQKENFEKTVESAVKSKVQSEKTGMEKKLRAEIKEETSEEIQSYQRQLEEKTGEIKKMNKLRSELAQAKRDRDELKEKIEAEAEEKINKTVGEEKEKIRKQVDRENELKFSEKEHVIETLNAQLKDMTRKLEQGSMQVQGEVQELAIEEYLRTAYPYDLTEPVGKGVKGADVILTVRNKIGNDCGKIIFESKRTKSFSDEWVSKLKFDAMSAKADILVIITETMPEGIDKIGIRNGVWISSFKDYKGLVLALRESHIKINNAFSSQINKGEKMQMLYDYLCGSEFQLEITAIVEAFTQMNTELLGEQRSMAMLWKRRQKQIDRVLQSTIHMYGSIKGIAGNEIGTIQALELPAPIEE